MRYLIPVLLALGLTTASIPAAAFEAPAEPIYAQTSPSRDGIGKVYMGREISKVMGHRGAAWLERGTRVREELPERLIDSMQLAEDAVVADVGAGTGYFSFRISPRVPYGRVYAVDIQPEMLAIVQKRIDRRKADNVVPVRGTVDDPNLPEGAVDAVLLVDAYHEFSHPYEMMRGIVRSLRRGGRVFLVEYRGEDKALPIKPLHKMTEAQAKREMAAVGLEWVETLEVLPTQHLMVFRRP
jgi:ubiquinone/menaquinone biosynthesis C-methylase UbiE